MVSLAVLAIVLPFAATPSDAAVAEPPPSSAPAETRNVDAGDALHVDRDRVFLDWGTEARVLRMRAKKASKTGGDDATFRRLVLASGEPVQAPQELHPSDAEPVLAEKRTATRTRRERRVKKTALQSLSVLAEILAGGQHRRTAPTSTNGTPLPHFEARDDDTRRVGHPPR